MIHALINLLEFGNFFGGPFGYSVESDGLEMSPSENKYERMRKIVYEYLIEHGSMLIFPKDYKGEMRKKQNLNTHIYIYIANEWRDVKCRAEEKQ